MAAIVLLVLHAVGTSAYAALGTAAAIVSAALVGAVSLFSARLAGTRQPNNAWFVVPMLVFTALPLAARVWTLVATEQGWWVRAVEFTPFLIGFAGPVLLLMVAYLQLPYVRQRTELV
jgi:protein-S-isoprenylcysteine O-methyltransferase Ste14